MRLGSFLKHPLVLLIIGGVFTAVLIPQVTREWQDRQSEQEIKRSLLEEIATSATSALREGNSLVAACAKPTAAAAARVCAPTAPGERLRAAGGEAGEDVPEVYAALRNSWLIRRSTARSRITTYFPAVYSCWYSYERAIADYLGLVTGSRGTKRARVGDLGDYVRSDLGHVYARPSDVEGGCARLDDLPANVQARFAELKAKLRWPALEYPAWHPRFKQEYAKLAEALEIAMERIITTIVAADARGFSHGIV